MDEIEIISYASYMDKDISYNHKCFNMIDSDYANPQTHNAVEFIYLKKGSIIYTVDEKTYKVDAHRLLITLPRKLHTITFNELDVYDRYDVLVDENVIFPSVYEKIKKAPHVINCKNLPHFYELFKRFDYYRKNFSDDEFKNLSLHLVDELAYNIALSLGNVHEEDASVNLVLSKVLEYIENNLTLGISVKNICNDLYISASYLHNLFKEYLNITPKKYIDLKRLTLAQNFLSQGEIATSVYEKCGFSDYSVFYRSYKNHFGYPPSQEKNRNSVIEIIY